MCLQFYLPAYITNYINRKIMNFQQLKPFYKYDIDLITGLANVISCKLDNKSNVVPVI